MSFTHRVSNTYIDDSGVAIGQQVNYTGAVEKNYDNAAVPAATSDLQINIAFAHANLQCFCLYSSQAATLVTNSTSSPGDTINLNAGENVVWTFDSWAANPFTVDVTTLYLSVPGANPSNVKFRFLLSS